MDLRHYTSDPMVFNPDQIYIQRPPRSFNKPSGLWVSVVGEQDWPTWCRDEDHGLGTHEYRVTLTPCARIHYITNLFAFDAFHGTYSVQEESLSPHLSNEYQWGQRPIDWRKVATDCDGIIIAPYQWERRMMPSWYYGWDCASGCIWNPAVIKGFEGIKQSAAPVGPDMNTTIKTGVCPVCNGTARRPVSDESRRYIKYNARWGHWGIAGYEPAGPGPFADGSGYEGGTFPCTNCGGQTMSMKPTGQVPLRADGTPCTHEYKAGPLDNPRRGAHDSVCKHCGYRFFVDSGD